MAHFASDEADVMSEKFLPLFERCLGDNVRIGELARGVIGLMRDIVLKIGIHWDLPEGVVD